MPTTDDRSARPIRDEWGVYDPEQAGLAAVMRRLAPKRVPGNPDAPAPPESTDTGAK